MSLLTDIFGGLAIAAQVAGAGIRAKSAKDLAAGEQSALIYNAQRQIDEAQINEWRAKNLVLAAGDEITKRYMRAAQIKGSQRARFAARGVDTTYGSAFNILQDTDFITNADIETLRDNVSREAWVLAKSASANYQNAAMLRARAGQISPGKAAMTSLLGDAGVVAKSWYRLTDSGGTTTSPGQSTTLDIEWSEAGDQGWRRRYW